MHRCGHTGSEHCCSRLLHKRMKHSTCCLEKWHRLGGGRSFFLVLLKIKMTQNRKKNPKVYKKLYNTMKYNSTHLVSLDYRAAKFS